MFGEVNLSLDDGVWWMGWHPKEMLLAGMAISLIAVYILGFYHHGILFLGLLFIALMYRYRRLYKAGMLILPIYGVIYVAFGYDGFLTILNTEPSRNGILNSASEAMLHLAGMVGGVLRVNVEILNPFEQIVSTIGIIASVATMGVFLGLYGWGMGVMLINIKSSGIYQDFKEKTINQGTDILGEHPYNLIFGEGTIPLVAPNKIYHSSNLITTESSIKVHHGSKINMTNRSEVISDRSKELYYDQVASIDYDDPYFVIKMADGEWITMIASERPEELIEELTERLRKYKTHEEKEEKPTTQEDTTQQIDEEVSSEHEVELGDGLFSESEDDSEESGLFERIKEVQEVFSGEEETGLDGYFEGLEEEDEPPKESNAENSSE